MSSMHLSSCRLWERINQNACIIKLIINEYPNNLSFDLLGFDPTVCLSLTQETALHRCILYLHYSKITRLSYKTKIMIHLLKDCLHLQDEALQTLLHTAAKKTVTTERKKQKIYMLIEKKMVWITKGKEMPGPIISQINNSCEIY